MESPSTVGDASAGRVYSSGKRPRADWPPSIEFDPQEVMDDLGVDGDHMVLGIDESGRGPVIGPMVYTGAMISLREHDRLVDRCNVADSKVLDEAHRRAARRAFAELKTLQLFTISLSAAEVAAAMTGRHGRNLNTLSHETAIEIIRRATLAGLGKLCAVYVDTVGQPETYQARLKERFPFLRVVVSKKADAKYPTVSAASIEAKELRDAEVASYGEDVGSGYPSDPKAGPWLRSHLHRFFVFPRRCNYVRQSWAPVTQLAKNELVCVPVVFEQDEANDDNPYIKGGQGYAAARPAAKQKRLSFAKPVPRRPVVYAHLLRLKSVSQLDDSDAEWQL